jgi:aspartate kinase
MKVFKFGGASVKSAEAVRNLAGILNRYHEDLVVVISAMGKITDLLESLVKAYFNKDNQKWDIFGQFKTYHLEICDQLFGPGKTPPPVLSMIGELESKLGKLPSLDYDFEYDQIVSYGELVSTRIVSDYLNAEVNKICGWISEIVSVPMICSVMRPLTGNLLLSYLNKHLRLIIIICM